MATWSKIYRSEINLVAWQLNMVKLWRWAFLLEGTGCEAGLLWFMQEKRKSIPTYSKNSPAVSTWTGLSEKYWLLLFSFGGWYMISFSDRKMGGVGRGCWTFWYWLQIQLIPIIKIIVESSVHSLIPLEMVQRLILL